METILLFILIIALILLAIYIGGKLLAAGLFFAGTTRTKTGGSVAEPTIQSRTATLLDQFLTEQLTPEIAENAEILSSDIAYDVDTITLRKLESADGERSSIQISKLILDTISHYFIYMKQPNSASRAGIENNVKILAGAKKLGLADEKVGKLCDLCLSMLVAADKSAEVKVSPASQRECFRREKILTIIASASRKTADEIANLRDELSRKNMELRNKESSTDHVNLMNCNIERRALQEKIYELRRDVDKYTVTRAASSLLDITGSVEIAAARSRLEELRSRNIALEEQLRRAHTAVQQDQAQCGACREELSNCKKVLDDVLGAN